MPSAGYWLTKPPAGTQINRGHPLAEGLAAVWAFNEGAGSANDSVGRVAGAHLTTSTSGATRPVWTANDGGAFDYSGSQFIASNTANMLQDGPFLGAITVLVRGLIRTGSAYRAFITKGDGAGGANNPFEFRTSNAATPALDLVRATTVGHREFAGPSVTLNKLQTWAVSSVGEHVLSTVTFYIDGVATAGTVIGGAGNANVTGSSEDVWVGRRQDGIVQMDGWISFIAVWSRALTTTEHLVMAQTPYVLFEAPVWRRIFIPGAATGASRSQAVVIV